jgi:PASTA domain
MAITRRLRARRPASGFAAVVAVLAVASPAFATTDATISAAPIGTGSYLVTVTNTGTDPISRFDIFAPSATNLAPSTCGPGTLTGTTGCAVTIAPGGTAQLCYTGGSPRELVPGTFVVANGGPVMSTLTMLPAVSSCPLAGWSPPLPVATPPATPAPTPTTPAVTPAPTAVAAHCVVPKLKGRKLADAQKAIAQAHCALGTVKKVRSKRVKKGRVISQGALAGKSLSPGTKVSLVISKAR